jgi:hypothetical protein
VTQEFQTGDSGSDKETIEVNSAWMSFDVGRKHTEVVSDQYNCG